MLYKVDKMDSFQKFSLISVVQFWPLSLCHATPGESVQGQLFVHALNKTMTEDILHVMSYEKLAGSFRSGEADCDHHDAMAKSTPTKVGKANKDGCKMRMLLCSFLVTPQKLSVVRGQNAQHRLLP